MCSDKHSFGFSSVKPVRGHFLVLLTCCKAVFVNVLFITVCSHNVEGLKIHIVQVWSHYDHEKLSLSSSNTGTVTQGTTRMEIYDSVNRGLSKMDLPSGN